MYQTLTNSGKQAPLSALRMVKDQHDNVLYQSMPKRHASVSEQAAWLTTYGMKRAVLEGTGRYLHGKFSWAALAGKTGTSNDSRDSWFVGVDGREVVTVWVGRDDNKPTRLTGSSGALRVYADYLDLRTPERLILPWPKGITTLGFRPNKSGAMKLDCGSQFKLPVWDQDGSIRKACERSSPATWLKRLFNW
jgi:penicillin-binding protein 1B